ncbi:MAG TPA: ABC transporter ATP-binding protein [Marmoricola sp.]|nr:ABC transporter ATP-binding protein [Marmoricola sp.]
MHRHSTTSPTTDLLIEVRGLGKTFRTLDADVTAADGIDLDIATGTITALVGPSGSGKSTLLHLIGALDSPDVGDITVAGERITEMAGRHLAEYRRTVGFVFQQFNLLPTLTVLDNVVVPLLPYRTPFDPYARGRDLLATVGLSGRENTLATRLSGGQQQRVAIARALINQPRLVLADEPTGNLDTSTGEEIIRLLFDLRDSHGATLVIATHDPDLAKRCDQVVSIRDGRILPSAT